MNLLEVWMGLADQLLGFFFWLLVMPIRLAIGLLDPVFSPITAIFDFTSFIDGIQVLRGFFDDVNWFIPFYPFVAIIEATMLAMFVLLLANVFAGYTMTEFGSLFMMLLGKVIEKVYDKVKEFLESIVYFFMGGE